MLEQNRIFYVLILRTSSLHSNGPHPYTLGTSSLKEEVPGVYGCGSSECEDEVLRIIQNNVRFCSSKRGKKFSIQLFILSKSIHIWPIFEATFYLSWSLLLREGCIRSLKQITMTNT